MDVYPNHNKHEESARFSMHITVLEFIIIDDTIIYSFTGCFIFVNGLPLFGIVLYNTEQAKIIFGFNLKNSTIFRFSAFFL